MPYTIAAPWRHEQDIRKSRFVAQAAPVADVDEAMAWFARTSDAAATHNGWAYRIGDAYRFNDDGEPGGTAGRPILQAIDGQDCDRVAVVVTRWYGGIKLGAGGLARAYGGTAAECLRLAPRRPLVAMARLGMHCDFAELALIRARVGELDGEIERETFVADGAELVVIAPAERIEAIAQRVIDLARGRIQPRRLD